MLSDLPPKMLRAAKLSSLSCSCSVVKIGCQANMILEILKFAEAPHGPFSSPCLDTTAIPWSW